MNLTTSKLNSKEQEPQYLTSDEVVEFRRLIQEIKGINFSYEEALDQGTRLIMMFEALQKFEPIPLSYKDTIDHKK